MNRLDQKEFLKILHKHQLGTTSPAEEEFLRTYYNILELEENFTSKLTLTQEQELKNLLKARIDQTIVLQENQMVVTKLLFPKVWAIAASLIFVIATALYLYKSNWADKNAGHEVVNQVIKPGGNKAILTLVDGTKISLTDADNGELINRAGLKVIKAKDGQLIFEASTSAMKDKALYNTVQTPRGGQYQINLPDGTKVWLNAASSLRFPSSFAQLKQRKVELSGEAYFEVAHLQTQVFVVSAGNQEIEVLGTHFNVNCYPDEPAATTSLLEGSVKVRSGNEAETLSPGEQAEVKDQIRVKKIRQDVIAWKNGITSFKDADIKTIMRQVGRWYDVEVRYEADLTKKSFSGEIKRDANLSELISVMQFSGIELKVEGRIITVNSN